MRTELGFRHRAPKGVVLDTDRNIAAHAREIYLQAGRSHAMPPANATGVTDEERQLGLLVSIR